MKILILLFIALFGFFYLESINKVSSETCVDRASMMKRAQKWVDEHVPYDSHATHDGYREDCSGFVSFIWELSKPGPTTYDMLKYAHHITKDELKDGDAFLCDDSTFHHILLFGGWTDSGHTHYVSYEETHPGEGTVKRTTPYPYWSDTGCFKPVRLNNAC